MEELPPHEALLHRGGSGARSREPKTPIRLSDDPYGNATLRQNLEANGLRNRMAVFPEAVGAGARSSIYGWISRLSSRPTISIRHRLRAGVESPCQWWEWRKSGVV
jgi:hypothetical protein